MFYMAKLNYVGAHKTIDKVQLLVKGSVYSVVMFLNHREQTLNLLLQLRKSLIKENDSSLLVSVGGCEYLLEYESWRALLYVLEKWFDMLITEEWEEFSNSQ